ncbi:MAG: trp operon repressor [Spirochaetaceae bacterium]|jgi:TrpR family trp operon transcriptional repressor|nr:trp operon repressor [Spirochaetaceae bacterium]
MATDKADSAPEIDELSVIFARSGDEHQIAAYLRALFTPRELADLASRWALVKALREKEPQREIAKTLGVSLCKITRGSRELKKEDSAFLKMLAVLEADGNGSR